MKRAILLAAAAVLALSGIYAKAPVVINNDDYIVCSQQKIKKLNWKICRKFRRTYWKEQISHDSIYIYHFFSIYRQFRQTGTFFNDWKLLPTDNFAIHRLYASYAYDRDLNIIGEYDFGDFYSFENIKKYWRIRIPDENNTIYYAYTFADNAGSYNNKYERQNRSRSICPGACGHKRGGLYSPKEAQGKVCRRGGLREKG